MSAIILSIGDELILGHTVDTNSAWLSGRLAQWGITVLHHVTIADQQAEITKAIRQATGQAELVLITGGLGPTEDDLTRYALAAAMGVDLELDPTSLERIETFFSRMNRPMVERNRVQAMMPIGAESLDNPVGTAPGIRATVGNAAVFVMPGVPREMKVVFDRHIAPWLDRHAPSGSKALLTVQLNTFGEGESSIAERLDGLTGRDRNPLLGTTIANGVVSVCVRSTFDAVDEAQRRLDATVAEVQSRLGALVFGRGDETLADVVGKLLKQQGKTLATAESCTGGLIGKLLTDSPGSSQYYHGGWITYANEVKTSQLGVPPELLEAAGAVSELVACTMAENARERMGVDYSLAVTGIAGPGGGSAKKPVGTAWLALADGSRPVTAELHRFSGDRPAVRRRAAFAALDMLRRRLAE